MGRPDRIIMQTPHYDCVGGCAEVLGKRPSGVAVSDRDGDVRTPSDHFALKATLERRPDAPRYPSDGNQEKDTAWKDEKAGREIDKSGSTRVFIKSVAHQGFLSAPDGCVVRTQRDGSPDCLWDILDCPHEPGSVYLLHCSSQKCLDTRGEGQVTIWSHSKYRSVDQLIENNVSVHAGNLRWKITPCPHQPGTVYIVNTRHGKFLDVVGKTVQVWNNNGNDIDTVVRENTSEHAANLRWVLEGL